MNRYSIWKYAVIVIAMLVGSLYTLPNFFGEAPAVQISSAKTSAKVDTATQSKVEEVLRSSGLQAQAIALESTTLKVRFNNTDEQLKAKDAIQRALNPQDAQGSYVVALNLISRSPQWLSSLNAAPMYLGLDLRGGVHFMLQVDMAAALTKKAESLSGDIRSSLREKNIRHSGISRDGQSIDIRFRDKETMDAALTLIQNQFADLQSVAGPEGSEFKLRSNLKLEAGRKVQEQALKQNITTKDYLLSLIIKSKMPGRVSGNKKNIKGCVTELYFIAFL